ncbi:unnamed protein product [Spirodela intermedia]|uniref:Uncharacterized protein n=1 Tax=Spirodela intermedia TaxID=51605 RepID=A0A7I8JJ43_SPIIN|nr:unnamed protein product [Spirodela intermedia]CAA6669805.1 unnamed protein product [Spirodela intermedia]
MGGASPQSCCGGEPARRGQSGSHSQRTGSHGGPGERAALGGGQQRGLHVSRVSDSLELV